MVVFIIIWNVENHSLQYTLFDTDYFVIITTSKKCLYTILIINTINNKWRK